MATPPSVTQITATPVIPIGNRNESVSLQRNVASEIWNSNTANDTDDGPAGSLKPVGFRLRKPISMTIKGEATYPKDWPEAVKGDCVIIGSIQQVNTPKIDVMKGSWRELMLVEPAPRQAPIPNVPFEVNVVMIEPLGTGQDVPVIPWGFAGDVEWRIETESLPRQQLVVPMKTRLEIYQLATIAFGGPTEALFAESTLPNFQGKWPVHLLRLFAPGPVELQGKAADIRANKLSWWAEFICRKVSSLGVQYDALEGRSGYGVSVLGGSFDITSFYDKVDPQPNPFFAQVYLALNSFDMTSLVEAAFRMLLPSIDAEDVPRPRLNWIGLTPCGDIADKAAFMMVPIGWQNDAAATQGVPTPFFKGRLAKKPEDGAMAATAWLEVEINPESPTPGTALILQIAFNTKGNKDKQPLPDVANISRAKFLRRHYEDPDPNAPKRVFFDSTSIPPVSNADSAGNNLGRRVGLYNLRGINEPWPWRYTATSGKPSLQALPQSLRTAIGDVLQLQDKKNNASTARRVDLVNSGSLRPSRIYALLKPKIVGPGTKVPQPDRYNGKTDYFRLVVGRGVSIASYIAPLDNSGQLKNVKARVKISTFETFSDALDGLVSVLGGFESDIKKAIVPNDPATVCGHYMVHTTQSLLFVRNNLLVDLIILDLASYGKPEANTALLGLANILDKDFILNSVPRYQSRKATFEITSPAPPLSPLFQNKTAVFIDKPFFMTISNAELLAEEIGVSVYSGQSNVGQPIIFTSVGPLVADTAVGTSTRKLGFLPLQNDADSAQDVDLAVSGAHYDTFYPVTKITTVELEK